MASIRDLTVWHLHFVYTLRRLRDTKYYILQKSTRYTPHINAPLNIVKYLAQNFEFDFDLVCPSTFHRSQSESELAGPKAAPLGRKQKQFKICRSSIMQGENYKIPPH